MSNFFTFLDITVLVPVLRRWDAIFQPDGFSETFAEMQSDTKNQISHRYKSLCYLRSFLIDDATHAM